MSPAHERLAKMIEKFLNGDDRSMQFASRIEGVLLAEQEFHNTELYDELSTPLACYRPGGGEGLCNEEEITGILRWALRELQTPGELKRNEEE